MDNQNISVGEEQQDIVEGQPTAHQLQKQERRLLERLREAQEAETRAIEHFKRAQAKLERRKARIQRLEQRLTQLKEDLAGMQAGSGEPSSDPGNYSDYNTTDEQRDEHTANGYVAVEEQPQEVSFSSEPVTPIPAFEPSAPAEVDEDAFEPEVHMTPELLPTPEVALEQQPEIAPEAELSAEPVPQPEAEEPLEAGTIEAPVVEQDAEKTSVAEVVQEPVVEEEAEKVSEVEAVQEPLPELDQTDEENITEASIPSVEEQPESVMPETPAIDAVAPEIPIAGDSPAAEPALDGVAPEIPAPDDSPAAEPTRTIDIRSLELAVMQAREIWQRAEAGVNLAQNRRQDLASSISVLAQANLSGALMDELLRKQSEANRAWMEAREQERVAAEKLAQAETAYRNAQ